MRSGRGALARLSRRSALRRAAGSAPAPAQHPAFGLIQADYVPEYSVACHRYRHLPTGAEVLSLAAADTNKVFSVNFRTPPRDSCGLPHILEHSVLCGSEKYPVKEPFADLLKGSLQTFLNAMTYPDRTCYPVASQNLKDFYNLADVYFDAVLHPRAARDEQVLQQEGWRYELPDGAEGELQMQGVVLNEMKGAYSSPVFLMAVHARRMLFAQTCYAEDAAGEPSRIPELTFADFRSFHQRFYHPSNALVFFYGDDDPLRRLEFADRHLTGAAAAAGAAGAAEAVAWQPLRSEPWAATCSYPAPEEAADEHMVTVNWVLNDSPMSERERLELSIANHLLLGSPTAFLEKALIDSHLGAATVGGGVQFELQQAVFSIGLKGVLASDVDQVQGIVLDTLQKCADEGFPADAVEASVNATEFALREFNTGGEPRGLSLMLEGLGPWVYGADPVAPLRFADNLAALRSDLAEGQAVFEDLLRRRLLGNPHRLTLTMQPDTEMDQRQRDQERELLAERKRQMGPGRLGELLKQQQELKEAQQREDPPEARATLPRLSLSDLDKKGLEIATERGAMEGFEVLQHSVPTSSGVLYAAVGYDASGLCLASELPLLPLFTQLTRDGGTSAMDPVAMQRRIDTHTGGVHASFSVALRRPPSDAVVAGDDLAAYVFVQGKALAGKTGELFAAMRDVLADANLDCPARAQELLREERDGLRAAVVDSGGSFAAQRIAARHTLAGRVGELTGGVTYLRALDALLAQAEQDWEGLLRRLESLRGRLLASRAGALCSVGGDAEALRAASAALPSLLQSLPAPDGSARRAAPWGSAPAAGAVLHEREGLAAPMQTAHVAAGGRLYPVGERVPGGASVAVRHLSNGYLWDTVRVQGGAYGVSCSADRSTGLVTMLSYSDPHVSKTLSTFAAAAGELAREVEQLDGEAMERAVIGTIGDLDAPLSAEQQAALGLRRCITGSTPEQRQQLRDEVLSASRQDFRDFAGRLAAATPGLRECVVASRAAIAEAEGAAPPFGAPAEPLHVSSVFSQEEQEEGEGQGGT